MPTIGTINRDVLEYFHKAADQMLPLSLELLAESVEADAGPDYPAAQLVAAVLRLAADLSRHDADESAWDVARLCAYGRAALRPLIAAIPADLLADRAIPDMRESR